MTHDLDAVLAGVLSRFAPMPAIRIAWAGHHDDAHHRDVWGQAWWTRDGRFIGVSKRLQRAPRYVVSYVVFHEVLHFALLPRDSRSEKWRTGERYRVTWHHRAFRVAERLWPRRDDAEQWLEKHA